MTWGKSIAAEGMAAWSFAKGLHVQKQEAIRGLVNPSGRSSSGHLDTLLASSILCLSSCAMFFFLIKGRGWNGQRVSGVGHRHSVPKVLWHQWILPSSFSPPALPFLLPLLSSIPSFSFPPPLSPFSPSLQQAFTESLKSVWHSAKHWGYIDKHCFYSDGPWVLSIFSLLLYIRMSFFFPFSPKCNGNERNSRSLLVFQ